MSVDTQDKTVTFKVELRNDANVGPLYRISGAVKIKNLVDLISIEDLTANPPVVRSARRSPRTSCRRSRLHRRCSPSTPRAS